jgi:hypothetical protein
MSVLPSAAASQIAASSGAAHVVEEAQPTRFHIGEPIEIAWQAPKTHSRKDWIGIYRLGGASSYPCCCVRLNFS